MHDDTTVSMTIRASTSEKGKQNDAEEAIDGNCILNCACSSSVILCIIPYTIPRFSTYPRATLQHQNGLRNTGQEHQDTTQPDHVFIGRPGSYGDSRSWCFFARGAHYREADVMVCDFSPGRDSIANADGLLGLSRFLWVSRPWCSMC